MLGRRGGALSYTSYTPFTGGQADHVCLITDDLLSWSHLSPSIPSQARSISKTTSLTSCGASSNSRIISSLWYLNIILTLAMCVSLAFFPRLSLFLFNPHLSYPRPRSINSSSTFASVSQLPSPVLKAYFSHEPSLERADAGQSYYYCFGMDTFLLSSEYTF